MCYGARSGALRAPELAKSPVVLILMLLFFCFLEAQIATKSDSQPCPQMVPKLLQNAPQIAPEWSPKWLQNVCKIGPGASERALGALLAAWKPLGGHWGTSWSALGSLLDSSGALLEESGEPLETTFSDVRSQKAPKTEPGGVQKRAPEATRAETGETLKIAGRLSKFLDF